MASQTYYNTGTASVTAGGTTLTFVGAALGSEEFPTILPGDLFMDPAQPEVPPQRIEEVSYDTDPQTAVLAFEWPGSTITAQPYEIRLVGFVERSTAQTRRYLELIGQLGPTGITINALGDFTDRDLYDAQFQGYTFLSMDGDGSPGSPPLIYIKQSSANADWSDALTFIGGQGPPGTGDKFDIAMFAGSRPRDGEILVRHVFSGTGVTLPAALAASSAASGTASAATATFTLKKNGASIGTVVFSTSDEGVFSFAAPVSFIKDDVFEIIAPSPRDATLADVSITVSGDRT